MDPTLAASSATRIVCPIRRGALSLKSLSRHPQCAIFKRRSRATAAGRSSSFWAAQNAFSSRQATEDDRAPSTSAASCTGRSISRGSHAFRLRASFSTGTGGSSQGRARTNVRHVPRSAHTASVSEAAVAAVVWSIMKRRASSAPLKFRKRLLEFRQATIDYLSTSEHRNNAYVLAQLSVSVVLVFLYIVDTYNMPMGGLRMGLETGLCVAVLVDLAARVIRSGQLGLLRSWDAAFDVVSCLPFLVTTYLPIAALFPACEGYLPYIGVLRMMRLLRLVRMALLLPYTRANPLVMQDAANWRIFSLCVGTVGLLCATASIVQILEQMPWHEALYFAASSFTPFVGVGDSRVATTTLGKLVVFVMVIISIVAIPVQTAQLYSLMSVRRIRLGRLPHPERDPTVLVATRVDDLNTFTEFFGEFFSGPRNRGGGPKLRSLQLLYLCNKPPFELRAFQELNQERLTLMEGSALSGADLAKCGAGRCRSILIIADRFAVDRDVEDTSVLFQVWSVRSYTRRPPLYVQTLSKEARLKLTPVLDPGDRAVSFEETTSLLMAMACVCPGSSTLISNLLRSTVGCSLSRSDALLQEWLPDYIDGCAFEIYEIKVKPEMLGMDFHVLAEELYRVGRATLIGIARGSKLNPEVFLNPTNHRIEAKEVAVLLARDDAHAEAAMRWVAALHERPASAGEDGAAAAAARAASGNGSGNGHVNGDGNGNGCYATSVESRAAQGGRWGAEDSPENGNGAMKWLHTAQTEEPSDLTTAHGPFTDGGEQPAAAPILSDDELRALVGPILSSSDGGSSNGAAAGVEKNGAAAGAAGAATASGAAAEGDSAAVVDPSTLTGHVVMAGFVEAMPSFVEAIRAANGADFPLVAIVAEKSDSDQLKAQGARAAAKARSTLRSLGNIHFVTGSPGDRRTLEKAGASNAASVVYLARYGRGRVVEGAPPDTGGIILDDTSTRSSSGYSAQRAGILADADALLMTASVNTLRPPAEIHTVVELVYTSSAALLLPSTVVRHKSAEDPDEAVTGREAGGTYSGGTRNPRNVEITQGRINRINMAKDGARLSWKKREIRTTVAREAGLAEWQASTFYSAGRVMLPSIMDTLACMCFYSPSGVVDQIVPALAGVGDDKGAVLRQIPVPANMLGQRYSELFRNLALSHGLVPVGLYRSKGGANGALSYVHTSPPPETVLKEGDKIFLLRPCLRLKRNGGAATATAQQTHQGQQGTVAAPPSSPTLQQPTAARGGGEQQQQSVIGR